MKPNERKCKMCQSLILGRRDKIYCSDRCKSDYHEKLKSVTNVATAKIDKILHRNRSTLLELMGKNGTQKKIPKLDLDNKKFNWTYITHMHVNSQGKEVRYVYDYSYILFSDQEVLIKRIQRV